MKLNQLILPVLALGTAGAFLVGGSNDAEAYSLIGGSLSLTQRDVRVFNNFSGNTDNNNQTPDANFPGYLGAVMAIWKGGVEWGSLPHGDGSGDPLQTELGSGDANFDISFQGEANGVGGTNDNIHSELSGSNGGVLAYCETPISNGWRIRYYQGWTWSDGPGSTGNPIDLQEVSCHEYGHALGLGHSTSGGATMFPSYSGGTAGRSISNDDRAGLTAIYGSMSSSKPTITGLAIAGNQLTVTGTNFTSNSNEVWFTQASSGGNGTPIKVTNVSSNGTSVTVTIPGSAGPGDVLVKKSGNGNAALSNAWPSDLQSDGPTCGPTNYCSSLSNSAGGGAGISSTGTASVSSNNLEVFASGMPSGKTGLFFFGPNQTSTLFGDGLLCVGGSITRLAPMQTDVLGQAAEVLDLTNPEFTSGPAAATPGNTTNFQFWFRDPAFGSAGFNTTDGLEVVWCP